MAILLSNDLAWKFIHALGLNDQFIGSVTITMNPNDVVKVHVTHFMTEEQSEKILELVKHYYLVEIPEPPVFPPDRESKKGF
jgi:hypothetical protein